MVFKYGDILWYASSIAMKRFNLYIGAAALVSAIENKIEVQEHILMKLGLLNSANFTN